jgi:hypothetical protein
VTTVAIVNDGREIGRVTWDGEQVVMAGLAERLLQDVRVVDSSLAELAPDSEEYVERLPVCLAGTRVWAEPRNGDEGARAAWDESKHPRDPGGEHGGEFIEKGTSAPGKERYVVYAGTSSHDHDTKLSAIYQAQHLSKYGPTEVERVYYVDDPYEGPGTVMTEIVWRTGDPTVTITGAGVDMSKIPYAVVEPTSMEDRFNGKRYMVREFASSGGISNPRNYVMGKGQLIKKDGTLGPGKNTIEPVGGIPPEVLAELERVAREYRAAHGED